MSNDHVAEPFRSLLSGMAMSHSEAPTIADAIRRARNDALQAAIEACYMEARECAQTCSDDWQNGALMCAQHIEKLKAAE